MHLSMNRVTRSLNSLAEMVGDGFLVEGGGLDHDQQRVVAADEVAEVLPGLDCRVVAPDEKQEELA